MKEPLVTGRLEGEDLVITFGGDCPNCDFATKCFWMLMSTYGRTRQGQTFLSQGSTTFYNATTAGVSNIEGYVMATKVASDVCVVAATDTQTESFSFPVK